MEKCCHFFDLAKVRLNAGPLFDRQEINRKYLLEMLSPDSLLVPFFRQAGLKEKAAGYGGWEKRDIFGHSLGHYMSALALLFSSTGDIRAKEKLEYIVDELAKCQDADGYVGSVPKSLWQSIREGRLEVEPFGLNKVWVPFYTLHKLFAGLRDGFRYTGNVKALDMERRLADYILNTLSGLNDERIQEMLGAEYGGMNEVLADLSADTGDQRYLEAAQKYFYQNSSMNPLLRQVDDMDGKHGNTLIPKVIGLARQAELTGNERYLQAAEFFWDRVVNFRSYANGGHGDSEHFFPLDRWEHHLSTHTTETCNSYNMQKLSKILFEYNCNAKIIDFTERALINHICANIGRKPGEFGYFVSMAGVSLKVFSTPFDSWWCCVGTGLENPTRYGELLFAYDDRGIIVNSFFGASLNAEKEFGVRLNMESGFPLSDRVRLIIQAQAPQRFALRLRKPGWTDAVGISLNGKEITPCINDSGYWEIEHLWNDGDELNIVFDMHITTENLGGNLNKHAIFYGPLLLSAVLPSNDDPEDDAKKRFEDHLKARGRTKERPPVLVLPETDSIAGHLCATEKFGEFQTNGLLKEQDLHLVPLMNVYEEHYALYLDRFTPEQYRKVVEEMEAQRIENEEKASRVVDRVQPGYQQSEIEHQYYGEKSRTHDFFEWKYRRCEPGGFFEYTLDCTPGQPLSLELLVKKTFSDSLWLVTANDVPLELSGSHAPDDEWKWLVYKLSSGQKKARIRFTPVSNHVICVFDMFLYKIF